MGKCAALVNAGQHLRILECSGDDDTSFREREWPIRVNAIGIINCIKKSLMQGVAGFEATGNLQRTIAGEICDLQYVYWMVTDALY